VLSNLVNAGYLRLCVLTQYKSHSLDRHVTTTWRMSTLLGNYVTPVPAQQRLGPRWFTGSADGLTLGVVPRPAGSCSVSLRVADKAAANSTASFAVRVGEAPAAAFDAAAAA